MTEWIFPSNLDVFKLKEAFTAHGGYIDWRSNLVSAVKGDIVYLYASKPKQTLIAKAQISKQVVSPEEQLDDRAFWMSENKNNEEHLRLELIQYLSSNKFDLSELRKNGLKGTIQSKMKVSKELRTYLNQSVQEFNRAYDWIAFYEELAQNMLPYKENQKEFYKKVHDAFAHTSLKNPFNVSWVTADNLNPFSVFSAINRNLNWENKKNILEKLKENFSVQTPIYSENYEGIPFSNNQNFLFMSERNSDESSKLWDLFELVVSNELGKVENEFVQLFDDLIQKPNIKWNLTVGLFWVQPRKFVPLDADSRQLVLFHGERINPEKNYPQLFKNVPSGKEYLELVFDMENYLASSHARAFDFPTFSAEAYERTVKDVGIQYEYFYDFQQYDRKRYIDPAKAGDDKEEMISFKRKGQRAREEFQKVISKIEKRLNGLTTDTVSSWINAGQLGQPYFRTFLRNSTESKNNPAVVISLSQKRDKIVWSICVDVLNSHASEEDFNKQNQVLNVPIEAPFYYFVEDNAGEYYYPKNQDAREIKNGLDKGEIKKVQVKYDIGYVEDYVTEKELIEEIMKGLEDIKPFYEATKEKEPVPIQSKRVLMLNTTPVDANKVLETGEWTKGIDSQHNVKIGEKVALSSLRKYSYPYDDINLEREDRGSIRSHIFYATGEIQDIDENGIVYIDWQPFVPAKEWFLYTFNRKVWEIDSSENEYKQALYDFLIHDKPQPLDIFINSNYWRSVHYKSNSAYRKKEFLEEVFLEEEEYEKLTQTLKRKKNIILQGPPGVGKTYAAIRLAYSILGRKSRKNVKMIQFHQSYSYEDFIEGYKPALDSEGFELKNGVFKEFVLDAINHPDEPYFFIIDEINRGNISKIFGELLMLIEGDKRDERYRIPLQYSGEDFYVPDNVHLIGMMNTADRGLALLDYALRRRFAFFDMEPAFENSGYKQMVEATDSNTLPRIINKIKALNDDIQEDASLGPGFEIGHSYFTFNPKEYTDKRLPEIVEYEVLPLLREYWFDDPTKVSTWGNQLMEVFDE